SAAHGPRPNPGRCKTPELYGNTAMALELQLNPTDPLTAEGDCVIVVLFAEGQRSPAGKAVHQPSHGRRGPPVARGGVSGKAGRSQLLPDLPGLRAPRLLVVGLGELAKFSVPGYLKGVADAVRALRTGASRSALLTLSELEVPGRDRDWALRQ